MPYQPTKKITTNKRHFQPVLLTSRVALRHSFSVVLASLWKARSDILNWLWIVAESHKWVYYEIKYWSTLLGVNNYATTNTRPKPGAFFGNCNVVNLTFLGPVSTTCQNGSVFLLFCFSRVRSILRTLALKVGETSRPLLPALASIATAASTKKLEILNKGSPLLEVLTT